MKKETFALTALCIFACIASPQAKSQIRDNRDPNDTVTLVFNGDAAPYFEVFDRNYVMHTTKDILGTYSLVVFYATWCHYCQGEMPEVQELFKKYGRRSDFRLFTVSRREKPEEIDAFFRINKYTMPVFIDTSGKALLQFTKRGGIPRSYLFNKEGILMESTVGFAVDATTGKSNFSVIREELDRVLK